MFIILHLGMCWDTLLMIKSLWFRLDIKLFRWTFHSWDSSIWMPRSLVCCVLLMIVSPTLISVSGWVKAYWPGLSHSMRMAATPHREARTVKLEMEDKMVQIRKSIASCIGAPPNCCGL